MATAHDNVVIFSNTSIKSIQYVKDSFVITDGQPYSAPVIEQWYPDWTNPAVWVWKVTVSCGREGSTEVADSFNALVPDNRNLYVDHKYPDDEHTNVPQNLNFYFTLLLKFGNLAEEVPLYVAQGGYYHAYNLWWLGGPSVLNSYPNGSESAFLVLLSGTIVRVQADKDWSTFTIFELDGE